MTDIIRTQEAIATATAAQLVATYNALAGKEIKKFETRAIAEARVRMAILSAQDAAGHAGVPKGSKPEAATTQELAAKAAYPYGSMRAKLHAEIEKQAPITPRPKKADMPTDKQSAPRTTIMHVRATLAGTSKCQTGSIRAAVLAYVQERTQRPDTTVSVAELDAHFGHSTRGYLQKLLEKNHIIAVPAQQEIEGA